MKPKQELQWQKGRDGWIPLDRLNIESNALNGVSGIYILWAGKEIVKIGKGPIRDGLIRDLTNREIKSKEGLMVTWCAVEPDQEDSILKYLTNTLKPKIADQSFIISDVETSVYHPWEEKPLKLL